MFGAIAIWSFFDLYTRSAFIRSMPVLVLVLLAAFRSVNVGNDTQTYVNDYTQMLWGYDSTKTFERGFEFIQRTLSAIQAPVWAFFMIVALLTIAILSKSFSIYTNLSTVALLYYFSRFYLNRDLNQIRAGLASAILMYSLNFMLKRELSKFLIVVVIAAQFHGAALIMIVVYPFFYILQSVGSKLLMWYLLMIASAMFFAMYGQPIVTLVVRMIGHGVAYVDYDGYVDGAGLKNPVIYLQIAVSISAVYMYTKALKAKVTNSPVNSALLSAYMVSTIILISLSNFAVLAGRLSTLLATGEPLLLIVILKSILPDAFVTILMIVLSLLVFYVVFVYTGQLALNYEPYVISFN